MEPIRILLADDHTLFRKGIWTLLQGMPGLQIVGEAGNGQEATNLAHSLIPDVVLMDISMPGMSGIEATQQILKENPHIGIVLVTMFDEPESAFEGMRAGARGYVLKEAEPEELRRVVEAAHRGEVMLCPIIASKVIEHFERIHRVEQAALPYERLTQRELEVLQQAANGGSNKEIATELNISEKTVKNHVANIFAKLQVNDRTQAVLFAVRKGLVHFPSDSRD